MNRSSHGKFNPSSTSGDESTAEISLSSFNTDTVSDQLGPDRFHTSLDMDTHNPATNTTGHATAARRHLEAIVAGDDKEEEDDDADLLQESFAIDDTGPSGLQTASAANFLSLDNYVSEVEENEEEEEDILAASSQTK